MDAYYKDFLSTKHAITTEMKDDTKLKTLGTMKMSGAKTINA